MALEKQYSDKKSETLNKTKVLWHARNSVKSLLEAVAAEPNGLAGVEYDVVETSDNIPMLMHDKTIKRQIINGEFVALSKPIEVSSLTAEELRQMRPDIDTLKEAFFALNNADYTKAFEFHLEIKSPSIKLWTNIQRLLKQYPRIDNQTIPRSFQENVLIQIKKDHPTRSICLLLGDIKEVDETIDFKSSANTSVKKLPDINKIKEILDGNCPKYVSVAYNLLTQDFIDAMKAQDVEVEVYTLNDIASLRGMGVDRIVTDIPTDIIESLNILKDDRKEVV